MTISKKLSCIMISVFLLAGCDPESVFQTNNSQNTVVVEMDQVAKALGRDERIKQKAEENNKLLSDKLKQYANKLKAELEQQKASLPEKKISQEQKDQFQKITLAASNELQKAQIITRQQSQEFQNKLIKEFRDEVMLVAKKIATEHGAKMAVTASSSILWYEDSLNITDEVIKQMRASN